MRRAGFTLLEVLVATLIMAIAVTALLSNLSTSLRAASRLADNDRASMVARAKMDELLLMSTLPRGVELRGAFDPATTGWPESGWRATVTIFDAPPGAPPGSAVLERIGLEIWWDTPSGHKTFALEAFRRGTRRPEEGVATQ